MMAPQHVPNKYIRSTSTHKVPSSKKRWLPFVDDILSSGGISVTMKYLSSVDIDIVNRALNFNTSDTLVAGGCDIYTTKAAKNDKKVYKAVEKSLESQHESLLRLSASLSPPQSELVHLNLSRSSPFGPLTEVSNRRTFAYLIATLNASHPDYDFTDVLKPSDFTKERSSVSAVADIDDTLYSTRPRTISSTWASRNNANGPHTPGGTPTWSPKMWAIIDDQITLKECDVFKYEPDEDPFEDGEAALWSMHYFFFNKAKKRVAYLHLRGLSILSHSPRSFPTYDAQMSRPIQPSNKRARAVSIGTLISKRAKHSSADSFDYIEADGPETVDDLEDESWGLDVFYESDDYSPFDHSGSDFEDVELSTHLGSSVHSPEAMTTGALEL